MATILKAQPWICQICSKPISGSDGYILIDNQRVGKWEGYDPDVSSLTPGPRVVNLLERARQIAEQQADEAIDMLNDPGVRFAVMHGECNPDPNQVEYWIACGRAATLDRWIAWVFHMSEKVWMKRRDTMQMLAFWYIGHGQPTPSDLG